MKITLTTTFITLGLRTKSKLLKWFRQSRLFFSYFNSSERGFFTETTKEQLGNYQKDDDNRHYSHGYMVKYIGAPMHDRDYDIHHRWILYEYFYLMGRI